MPPNISQQKPKPTSPSSPTPTNGQASPLKPGQPDNRSILDRIAPVSSKIGAMKVSLYGLPKSGKTRLACSFPKPLLVVGTEDGTKSVVGSKGIDFVRLQRASELRELIEGLLAGGKYASVVLDHASRLRDMMLMDILGVNDMPAKKPWGGNALQTIWGPLATELKEVLGKLLDLSDNANTNIIVIAHEQTFTSEEGENSSSEVLKPAVGSALGKSLCLWLNGAVDYAMQTFVRMQTVDQSIVITEGQAPVVNKVRTGLPEFCLGVGPHDVYVRGFRQAIGAPPLPDCIVDPSYSKIIELIQGK